MRKVNFIFLILLLNLLLLACSEDESQSSGDVNEDNVEVEESDEDQKITITENTLKVATGLTGPPNSYLNEETDEEDGFYIDLIHEIGDRLNYKVEFIPTKWASLIPSLEGGKVDIIAEAMYITEERKQQISFTDPVYRFGEGLVVHEKDSSTTELENLKDKEIGVQIGTTYAEMLEELGITNQLTVYETVREMMIDLTHERLDGVVADEPILIYMAEKDPNFNVRVVDSYEPRLPGDSGIGVNKENEALLATLNDIIDEIKEDGTLKEIHEDHSIPYYLD